MNHSFISFLPSTSFITFCPLTCSEDDKDTLTIVSEHENYIGLLIEIYTHQQSEPHGWQGICQ